MFEEISTALEAMHVKQWKFHQTFAIEVRRRLQAAFVEDILSSRNKGANKQVSPQK